MKVYYNQKTISSSLRNFSGKFNHITKILQRII